MNRRLFHVGVIAVAMLIGYMFWPTEPYETPEPIREAGPQQVTENETGEVPEEATEAVLAEPSDDEIILTGVFLGLIDGENRHERAFKYMLLDDGTEVLRIDLRGLIGYSDIDVIEKLGVERNDRVQVIGTFNQEGEFSPISIERE